MTATATPESQMSPDALAPPLVLEDVTVEREGKLVLSHVSLELAEHRIAILGPNGSGKSTLLRLLNGLLSPTTGEVRVGELTTAHHAKQIRREVGFVFQNPDNQIVMPVVCEDIAFGLRNLGIRGTELDARVHAVLDSLGLERLYDHETHTLSGGEKQMLALAAVLVMEPSTIVLDEPTTMLDLRNSLRVRREIARLSQRAIVATHDLELALECERAVVIDAGQVVFDGAPAAAVSFHRELCGAA
jgi:biotin transport system ATP-binding protein